MQVGRAHRGDLLHDVITKKYLIWDWHFRDPGSTFSAKNWILVQHSLLKIGLFLTRNTFNCKILAMGLGLGLGCNSFVYM